MATMVDALGFEELTPVSGTGMSATGYYFLGSIISDSDISGLNLYASGTVQGANIKASTVISGLNLYASGTTQSANVIATTMVSGLNVYASGTMQGANVAATTAISGANVYVAGYTTLGLVNSSNNTGVIVNTIPAETNITGGMWVVVSGASGTTPTYVCKAAAGNQTYPFGICLATTASGTANKPNILTRGIYKGTIAEATIAAGDAIAAGAGNGLNCAKVIVSSSGIRGTCVMGAGSEAVCAVYLF